MKADTPGVGSGSIVKADTPGAGAPPPSPSLQELAGCTGEGLHPGYWSAWLILGLAGLFVAIHFLYLLPTPGIDISGLVAETLICLIPLGGLFVVQHLRPCPAIYWPMMTGLSMMLLSHLADALDEVLVQPQLVGILIEDGLGVGGFALLILGLMRWVRFNQLMLLEIQAMNARLEERVTARTATLEAEVAERQQAEGRLRDSEQRYRELNAALEQRVAARTAELEAANSELQRLATTDRLTGIWNRHHGEEALTAEIRRVARYREQPLSVMLFDLDHFKAINDTHGHPVGDQVLIALTQRIQDQLRAVDVFARWGGEEFMLLLPHTRGEDAVKLAEKLRQRVAGEPFCNPSR